MRKLLLAPEALGDIASTAGWYDEKRSRFGEIYLLAVQDVFASVQRHPETPSGDVSGDC